MDVVDLIFGPIDYEADCLHVQVSCLTHHPIDIWLCDVCGQVFSGAATLMEDEIARSLIGAFR